MSTPVRGDPAHGVLERALLRSVRRRRFLRQGAAVAGGLAGLATLGPATAFAKGPKGPKDGDPSPIPGGLLIAPDFSSFTPVTSDPTIHVLGPFVGVEMSTITDFDGTVAAAEIQGTARDNKGGVYWFDCDMRFMEGRYIDVDGHERNGAFGFV